MSVKALRTQLIAAIAMLLVASLALGSSTYAWFSMNTTVTAKGMQVKAKAEGGIVISNSAKSTWGAEANSTLTTVTEMLPTSTSNLTNWYHGTSTDPSNANASTSSYANGAASISLKNAGGLGYFDADDDDTKDDNEDVYYLVTNYYIKSTTAQALQTPLYIKSVNVSTTTSATTALNGALRVAVKYGDNFYIYGSTASSTLAYYVGNQSSNQTTIYRYDASNTQINGVTSVANTDNGATLVQIYAWYEGEDTSCLSNNIAGLTPDTLSIEVQFSTTNS
ncbi:MAG: hypothetical protein IJP43_03050 [Oscillospiraceae bacterium]|nr:hypothetical protein [Oscillospiraceae bacterium]